ncbi:MAG: hypothetical protein ONB46_13790 [candidate division KSB1 bacterium]|nr:hypothetical protein [candidate division KSB1 bacterium]MDZ7369432.1 hypothetical protein [candidate division KSB1 bacterium]MDZ7404957.1 hypothetical protein [candidate division KSB1 bacterium]
MLKLIYADFSKEDRELVNTAFYAHLSQNERIAVIPETAVRAEMQKVGIDPAALNEAGYINAGKLLRIDYILVGKMEKIGDFVEVTFRLFKVALQTQEEYSGGKTLEVFVKQELPKIVEKIQRAIAPPTVAPPPADTVRVALPKPPVQEQTVEKKKRSKWPWIALGGVATGGAVAVILSSGGNEIQPAKKGLPRPPVVP